MVKGNLHIHQNTDQEMEMELDRTYTEERIMKLSKGRPWIGTCKGRGGERDLDICGEELSTMRHQKKGRGGVKLRGWVEIEPDGGILLMPRCSLRDNRN
jgi:hypothetical protein